ncbi:hypothetical protein [Streptomonospora litoralis]|uniref:Uncharacterized protein n=1 Tax=Streptomonospora litoralis TaxID=2498135 RepID=A0A4P6Q433_9ACTN|nr:hypothetical protein [Streptomonospora litoralis]QBI53669.1 hypothetical protein EKD16_09375 [Streptomonospora litoralis]
MTTQRPDSDVPDNPETPDTPDTLVIDNVRLADLDISYDAPSRVFTIVLAPGVEARLRLGAEDDYEQRRWLIELINHLTVTERSMRWRWIPPALRTTRG